MVYLTTTNIHNSIKGVENLRYLSIDKILQNLEDKKILTLDTETTSVDFLNGEIIMLQIGDETNQYIIDTRENDITQFKQLLEDETRTFIGHNLKFDYNFLKNYGIVLKNIYDTMVMDQMIHNDKYSMDFIKKNKRFSLSGVYKHYYGEELQKEIRNDFPYIGNKPYNIDHITYGAKDVIYPFKIRSKQLELIKEYSLENVAKLENKTVLALGDIEYNGLPIDVEKWREAVEKFKKKVKDTEIELDKLLLEKDSRYKKVATQLNLWTQQRENERQTEVNWSSDQQVLYILNNVFNLYPKDKYGKDSSGAGAIELLPDKDDLTSTLLKYREEEKIITSFGNDYLRKYVNRDGRIHTTFNQIVGTGRISSRNPNIQQIPSGRNDADGKAFRESLRRNDEGWICTADYASEEARIMADQANDESYIDFFINGDADAHSFVGTKLFTAAKGHEFIVSKTQNSEYRYKAKILNFMISFGGSAYTLSKTLKIPEKEAQELINGFFKAFPKLDVFFKESREFGLKKGFIRTNKISNRIRWFPEWRRVQELSDKRFRSREENSELMKLKGRIERKSQNTRIQGSAGDIGKTAICLFRKRLLQEYNTIINTPVKLIGFTHDELNIEADSKKLISKWSQILKECMEKAAAVYCKKLEIPAEPCIEKYITH